MTFLSFCLWLMSIALTLSIRLSSQTFYLFYYYVLCFSLFAYSPPCMFCCRYHLHTRFYRPATNRNFLVYPRSIYRPAHIAWPGNKRENGKFTRLSLFLFRSFSFAHSVSVCAWISVAFDSIKQTVNWLENKHFQLKQANPPQRYKKSWHTLQIARS